MIKQSKILILDSDENFAERIKKQLETFLGTIVVDTCIRPLCSIIQSQEDNYDLVVLKMDIPGIDGLEFIRILRQFDPSIKIIVTADDYSLTEIFGAVREGVEYYLNKPFNIERLVGLVKTSLNTEVYQQTILHTA